MYGCSFDTLFGWHGWLGMFPVLLIVAVVAYFLMSYGNTKKRRTDSDDSLSILKRRLAMGEITVEEFNTLKQYL
jgi:Predicted membrane protein